MKNLLKYGKESASEVASLSACAPTLAQSLQRFWLYTQTPPHNIRPSGRQKERQMQYKLTPPPVVMMHSVLDMSIYCNIYTCLFLFPCIRLYLQGNFKNNILQNQSWVIQ